MEIWPNNSESLRKILEGKDKEARGRSLTGDEPENSNIQDSLGTNDDSNNDVKIAVEYRIINLKQTL
jgi:hypothetical protein